jgi:ribosomal subunit interface protein
MQKGLQLRWRNVTPSEAVEAHVREEVERLERFHERITGCEVTLESPSRHHRNGAQKYRVRIELSVPGGKLVVARDRARNHAQADLYVAVRAAFREAKRQLQDHVRKLDARVKLHVEPPRATVAVLMPDHGFLRTAEGREIYFHERSVLRGGFARLRLGDAVRFAEESGEQGPQASTVELLRAAAKHAPAAAARA